MMSGTEKNENANATVTVTVTVTVHRTEESRKEWGWQRETTSDYFRSRYIYIV